MGIEWSLLKGPVAPRNVLFSGAGKGRENMRIGCRGWGREGKRRRYGGERDWGRKGRWGRETGMDFGMDIFDRRL